MFLTRPVWMLHPAAGSLCRMTEVHRCWWQLIICCTLQKRDSVIDWWAVVYSRTAIVIHPFIIQSFQDTSKLETCFFVKFLSFYNICLFVGSFRIWRNVYLADIRTPIATQQRWRKRLNPGRLLHLSEKEKTDHRVHVFHKTWNYFAVHMELWTAMRLNFRTVKVML